MDDNLLEVRDMAVAARNIGWKRGKIDKTNRKGYFRRDNYKDDLGVVFIYIV